MKIAKHLSILITLAFLCSLIFPSFASTLDGINHITGLAENFEREKAYELMVAELDAIDPLREPFAYLEALRFLVAFEQRFALYGEMIIHAIELYNHSKAIEDFRYMPLALEAMALFDMMLYSEDKMNEKIQEILAYKDIETKPSTLFHYYSALSNYYAFNGDSEMALKAIGDAFNELGNEDYIMGFNYKAYMLLKKGYELEKIQKHQEAIDTFYIAIDHLNKEDSEMILTLKYRIALNHFYLDQLEKTDEIIDHIIEQLPHQSIFFRRLIPDSSIYFIKAEIYYRKGDYKDAADAYAQMYRTYPFPDSITDRIIEGKNISEAFERSGFLEEINLLEALKQSQALEIKQQERNLRLSRTIIGLLALTVTLFVAAMIWQHHQKKIIYNLSITDPLTQVYNRGYLMTLYDQIRPGQKCIALIDLDHFKAINDVYGHQAGDDILKSVAQTMRGALRETDVLGRYGGEEFMVILDTRDLNLAHQIMERLRADIENMTWTYPDLKVTASIGLVSSFSHVGDLLLNEADRMLYEAKSAGRNNLIARLF